MAKKYTEEQHEFLRTYIPGHSAEEIANEFNRRFPDRVINKRTVHSYKSNNRVWSGTGGRFQKGNIPFNKGKKGIHYSPATEFKKGHIPGNYCPVGTIKVRKYRNNGEFNTKYIKIADPSTWIPLNQYNWEQANGPVPEGYCLFFKDGNPLNCELDNLRCAPLGIRPSVSKFHETKGPARDVAITISELKYSLYKKKKSKSEGT